MAESLEQKLGKNFQTNVPLAGYVGFKIGGPAKYFYIAQTSEELLKALKAAEQAKIKYFILGSGTNILISDQGFAGLVIKSVNTKFEIKDETVKAESGAIVTEVLAATLKAGLTGWAWVAGLPGTIGAAVRGNAGAYGQAMGDIVTKVEVYQNDEIQTLTDKQMKFSYRHSVAKETSMVILSVEMKLKKGDAQAELKQVDTYNKKRQDTQPLEMPNAGCVFKNINLKEIEINPEKVKKGLDISDEEYKEATKFDKLPVSYLIDKLGLKGKTIGGAQVSKKHGAFIVNTGKAKAEDVIMLISDLKMRVRNELGIQLQEEIQYVGF